MMKKKYDKPQIAFEDMTLNTAIASCEAYYVDNCVYFDSNNDEYDGIPYFVPSTNDIFIDADMTSGSGCTSGFYCYHVMNDNISSKS